ncbi:MAG: TonB-dependent siderophore receptor [Verrucomicrobiales bacterium]
MRYAGSLLGTGLAAGLVTAQESPELLPETVIQTESAATSAERFPYVSADTSSALFSDTPLLETPFSVGVYNEELMEDQRAFTLPDVLRNDPSVSVQMPGGFYGTQNFGLRGFRVSNFNGYRIDGLTSMNLVAPFLDDKARVELLKGSAALRFGLNSPGGAINLVRKRPTAEPSTSLHFDIDTFGRYYSQLDTRNTVADGAFGYRLVLGGEEYDSFYDNAGGDRFFGSLYTEWNPNDSVRVWSSISAQEMERNGYYGPMISGNGVVLNTGDKTNIMQDWARNEQEVFDAALGVEIELNPDWSLHGSWSYQTMDRASRLSYPYGVQDNGDYTGGALLTDGPFEWDSHSGHAHIEGVLQTGPLTHDIVFGAQYRAYDSVGSRAFPDVGPNNAFNRQPYPIPVAVAGSYRAIEFEYEEYGVFLTDTIDFGNGWSTLLGGRYSKYENMYPSDPASDNSDSHWSPTLALMYEPVENVHAYATYSRGVQDGGTARRTAANAFEPLGAQESEQWELGVKSEWCEGRYSAELALFQIEQDVAILNAANVDVFNGQQQHRGVELAFRGQFTDELQAGIAAAFIDAEQDANGFRPQHVPAYQVNLWSVLEIPQVPGLALTANARFTDKQYLDQGEQFATDSYVVVDLGARYRWSTDHADYTFRARIENVFDESYYETGEFYPGDAGYLAYGEPINANLSLQIDF